MTNFLSTTSIETEPVMVRRAATGDVARIRDLAYLDDKRLPAGPFLVAELGGEITAAVSLSKGIVVADPFRTTADAVAILRLRAAQLGAAGSAGIAAPRIARRAQAERTFAVAA